MKETPKIRRIREAFTRDETEHRHVHTWDQIPPFFEALTSDWLTDVICRNTFGAKVTQFRLSDRDDGTSNRRRIYLEYNEAGRRLGLPSTVFCKATCDLQHRIHGSSANSQSEVLFYARLRDRLDVEAPEAIYCAYDPVTYRSFIMLRDLGDDVEFIGHDVLMTMSDVKTQLDTLAALHTEFLQDGLLETDTFGFFTYSDRFSNIDRNHGLAVACFTGFEASRDFVPRSLTDRIEEIWPATLASVADNASLPPTVCHGDVHLKNWYRGQPGRVGLSDFQGIHRGHWSRDLAYLLSTCLTIDQRRAWEKELIEYYIRKIRSGGIHEANFEDAWLHYRRQLMTVLAWWTVTLTPGPGMPDMQPADITIEFIRRIAQAIEDTGSLDSF